jgi:hypothetical protein
MFQLLQLPLMPHICLVLLGAAGLSPSYSCYLVHMTVVDWILTLPSYFVTITHTLVLYHILANTVSLAVVLVVLFEAPLLHIEKLLFGFMGLGKLPQVKKKAKVA